MAGRSYSLNKALKCRSAGLVGAVIGSGRHGVRGLLLAFLALFVLTTAGASFGQTITTIAGNGTAGFSGDGGPANSASLINGYAKVEKAVLRSGSKRRAAASNPTRPS